MKLWLLLHFLCPVVSAEWSRTQTRWTNKNIDFYNNFTSSIFYIGNPHVTYKEFVMGKVNGSEELTKLIIKGERYSVLNDSVPISFNGVDYYWTDSNMTGTGGNQVCEYRIGHFDVKLVNTRNNGTPVAALYYKCGILSLCEGLQCIPLNYKRLLIILAVSILIALILPLGLWVLRKCRLSGKKQKKSRSEQYQTRPNSPVDTADTAV